MKAVILAGGGGTRLWPLSTPDKPKQFQKLISNKTMLEETVSRLDFLKPEDIYIAINAKHFDLVKELCPQIPEKNIIIEPALRDTAPCIGLAAAIIEKNHPGEVMAVIYADHLIQNKEEFQNKLHLAEELCQKENTLNIIEVPAKEPNTHFGYVKLGSEISKDIYYLDSFKEKPDLKTAEEFVKSGNYLWNTGLYVWKASALLEKYKELKKEMYSSLTEMAEKNDFSAYAGLEKISIDYAIMEKVDPKTVRIIKADLGWSDIGNWEAIWQHLSSSPDNNITRGETKLLDCEGCLIYGDQDKQIAAIGLKDIIIIDTKEGLIVCQKNDSKRIKEIQ